MSQAEHLAIPGGAGAFPVVDNAFTPSNVAGLYRVAKMLVVLNLLDAVFTLYWIRTGLAEEANAFMRDLVVENAVAFVLVKIALVSLGAIWLLRFQRYPLAKPALMGCCALYFLVFLYHLRFSGVLLLG